MYSPHNSVVQRLRRSVIMRIPFTSGGCASCPSFVSVYVVSPRMSSNSIRKPTKSSNGKVIKADENANAAPEAAKVDPAGQYDPALAARCEAATKHVNRDVGTYFASNPKPISITPSQLEAAHRRLDGKVKEKLSS